MFIGCVETEYHNNLSLMKYLAYKIHINVGGKIDDLEEVATTWLFMKAIQTFNPNKGKQFRSHLYKVVWDDLYAMRRKEIRRAKRCPMDPMDVEEFRYEVTFIFDEFLEDLTENARTLAKLALNPPDTIACKKDDTPRFDSLRRHTVKKLKWTVEQFQDAADEIRGGLC